MNKDKFLTELRAYLNILEKQEQEDILEEYAQHIDMKIQKGLSEEEAINDFGPVEELAAEILEAYHVNPEFRRQGFSFKLPRLKTGVLRNPTLSRANQGFAFSQNRDDNMQEEENSIKQAGSRFKEIVTRAMRCVGKVFRLVCTKCRVFGGWLTKPFKGRRRKPDEGIEENVAQAERTKEMGGYAGRFCCNLCRHGNDHFAGCWSNTGFLSAEISVYRTFPDESGRTALFWCIGLRSIQYDDQGKKGRRRRKQRSRFERRGG